MSKHLYKSATILLLVALTALLVVSCTSATPEPAATEPSEDVSEPADETVDEAATEDADTEEPDEPEAEVATSKSQLFVGTNGMTGKHYNPVWLTSNPQFLTFPLILPALTWFDENVQPVLDLATNVEVNDDATVFTFYLPENATWSDGEPLTTEDVYFTYKLAISPDIGQSVWANNYSSVAGVAEFQAGEAEEIEGIKIVDDYTIRFELKEPNATFLFNTYLGILPEHILGPLSVEELELSDYVDAPVVTSGPYDFVEYKESQYIHLTKKADYWGKEVQIDEIYVELFEDQATILAQLEAGELDIASVPSDEVERFSFIDHIDVLPVKGIGYLVTHIDARSQAQISQMNKSEAEGGKGGNVMNGKPIISEVKPYLQEKSFRQALAYAVDTTAVINVLAEGHATPIYSPIFGPSWAVNPDLNTYERDVDMARSLMEEAGVTFTEEGTALWDEEPIILVFLAVTNEQARQLGEILQQQLGDVGIRVDIKLVTSSAFLAAAIGGDGDLVLNSGGRFGAEPSTSSLYYTCKAGWAELVMGYCNPDFDELMEQGVATSSIDERQAIYFQASAVLNDELPSLFFYSADSFIGISTSLSGVKPSADPGYLTWNIEEWSVSK